MEHNALNLRSSNSSHTFTKSNATRHSILPHSPAREANLVTVLQVNSLLSRGATCCQLNRNVSTLRLLKETTMGVWSGTRHRPRCHHVAGPKARSTDSLVGDQMSEAPVH